MRTRTVLALALVVGATGAGGAGAAPRQVCRLLGPSNGATVDAPNAALDIASADIASNSKAVTTVIRMKTLDDPQAAATGRWFGFYFSPSVEESYVVATELWASGPTTFALYEVSSPFYPRPNDAEVKEVRLVARVRGVVDTARHEVRATIPMTAFRLRPGSAMRPGAPVSYLAADVTRLYGPDPGLLADAPADVPRYVGTGGRWTYGGPGTKYVLGTPSCVAVGR